MKSILYIVQHRRDRSPGQRFRCEQFFDFLEKNDYRITYSYIIGEKDDKVFYSKGRYFTKFLILIKSTFIRIKDVMRANRFDVIFIYRESFMLGTAFFEYLFSLSKAKIVYDFDDAIWLNDISNGNNSLKWMKNPSKFARIIRISDMVFAGNNYLYEFACRYNSNVKILPTTIDTNYHKKIELSVSEKRVCIGWTGSFTTIKHFEYAIPFLRELKNKFGSAIYFKLIVDFPYKIEDLNLVSTKWKLETEIEDLAEFDIGIMPLPDNDWAKGKCGFKGLQCMAMEIPTVMSSVGVNMEIITDGLNGYLASDEKEWVDKVSMLIEDSSLRERIGKKGRETIIDRYSVDAHKNNYVKYLDELISK